MNEPTVSELAELVRRVRALEEENRRLERALESRVVIEQAKGVLAERLALTVDDAFELLRYAARSSRSKIHELAARVVYEPSMPNAVVVALSRQSRWRAALMRERNEAREERLDELLRRVQAQVERTEAKRSRRERAARNESLLRRVNEAIGSTYARADEEREGHFVCECSRLDCRERVDVPLADYERVRSTPARFVVAPWHVEEGVERVVERSERYAVVEKVGAARAVAQELDPRGDGPESGQAA